MNMTIEMGIKKFIQESIKLSNCKSENQFARSIGADRQLVARWLGKSIETKNTPQQKIDPRFMIAIQELTKEDDEVFWKRFKRQLKSSE